MDRVRERSNDQIEVRSHGRVDRSKKTITEDARSVTADDARSGLESSGGPSTHAGARTRSRTTGPRSIRCRAFHQIDDGRGGPFAKSVCPV